MKNCSTCKYWINPKKEIGNCDLPFTITGEKITRTQALDVIVDVSDDSGLNIQIETGANFGCVNHQEK